MYDEASSLDVYHLVEELSVLDGGKVNKVYEWEDQEAFIFKLYAEGETRHLRVKLPGLVYVTERRFQAPKIPPGYARFLRNKLTAARITDVRQHSFDRLIEIDIDSRRHGDMTLILEVFKPANIILVDADNTVIHPYRQQTFKDRTITSNEAYEYPPERPDTPSLTEDELISLLDGDENVEKAVAVTYGLGGVYAPEITARTGVDPDTPVDDLTREQKQSIAQATQDLFEEQDPRVINGEAYPIRMESLEDQDSTHETFSDALDTVHDYDQVIRHDGGGDQAEKYKTIIDAQKKQIESFKDAIEDNQRKANYIYEHYQDFATLIYTLREHRREGSIDEALDQIDNVVSYDEATNEVTLEFDDAKDQ